jgi:hypothetical protein
MAKNRIMKNIETWFKWKKVKISVKKSTRNNKKLKKIERKTYQRKNKK